MRYTTTSRITINSAAVTTPNGPSTITGNVQRRKVACFGFFNLHKSIHIHVHIIYALLVVCVYIVYLCGPSGLLIT
ncbi:hypothetical protein HanXRQr2_Chr03g0100081 [Helianthus annuus]|uniref:Transmembrane protein n=1 Tax=Helianthus annuus TaxID=4232 RepID=A0A9K3JDE0_HELAN|nr:hypothetical protein HanXRQr2_Chr03g0100081 [Helianthus annuus]KAJ0942792.1 hypothetical protein HanPSC8_Chr03g0096341 [Helianthus annuus]